MKFMLIIMSVASHSHMGKFIWKFHLLAEISPCSIHYQYDVEKRRREKITQTYFHPRYSEEGMREKEQLSAYQKDGSASQGFSYGYSFWSLFMGGGGEITVNKLLLQFTRGTRSQTVWICIKHTEFSLQGHTVEKCKCVWVSQCRPCLHMNKS